MTRKIQSIKLHTDSEDKQLQFDKIEYLGSGAYSCNLKIASNGFMCDREFGFDNDEYFLAKARKTLATETGTAELTDLSADSFLKFQPFGEATILISGLIHTEEELTQTLEFAFTVKHKQAKQFIKEFEKMVKANT